MFDYVGDLFSKTWVVTLSPAIKVGMVLNRLGDSECASQLVMNDERLKQWHDFKTDVINITRPRAAAAGAHYALAGENTLYSGIQLMDIDAVSKGTGKGRGSESRIFSQPWETLNHVERLLVGQRQEIWRQRKGQERQDQRQGQRQQGQRTWRYQESTRDGEHCQLVEM